MHVVTVGFEPTQPSYVNLSATPRPLGQITDFDPTTVSTAASARKSQRQNFHELARIQHGTKDLMRWFLVCWLL